MHVIAAATAVEVAVLVTLIDCDVVTVLLTDEVIVLDCDVVAVLLTVDDAVDD